MYPGVGGMCQKSHSKLVGEAVMLTSSLLTSKSACLLLHHGTLKPYSENNIFMSLRETMCSCFYVPLRERERERVSERDLRGLANCVMQTWHFS